VHRRAGHAATEIRAFGGRFSGVLRWTVLWGALALLLGGCTRGVVAERAVFGPHARIEEVVLFESVADRLRESGYEVVDANVEAGELAVRSHHTSRQGRGMFRFRFYRGGWYAVDVVGGGARRNARGELVVPLRLHAEYAELLGRISLEDR
jgi:hypothetical protein